MFNEKMKELLISKGMTKSQIESKSLEQFISICSEQDGLLNVCEIEEFESFISKSQKEVERIRNKYSSIHAQNETQIDSLKSKIDDLEKAINRISDQNIETVKIYSLIMESIIDSLGFETLGKADPTVQCKAIETAGYIAYANIKIQKHDNEKSTKESFGWQDERKR